jgi:hypothetical protein
MILASRRWFGRGSPTTRHRPAITESFRSLLILPTFCQRPPRTDATRRKARTSPNPEIPRLRSQIEPDATRRRKPAGTGKPASESPRGFEPSGRPGNPRSGPAMVTRETSEDRRRRPQLNPTPSVLENPGVPRVQAFPGFKRPSITAFEPTAICEAEREVGSSRAAEMIVRVCDPEAPRDERGAQSDRSSIPRSRRYRTSKYCLRRRRGPSAVEPCGRRQR